MTKEVVIEIPAGLRFDGTEPFNPYEEIDRLRAAHENIKRRYIEAVGKGELATGALVVELANIAAEAVGTGFPPVEPSPAACYHPVLRDDTEQPKRDIYICSGCGDRFTIIEYRHEPGGR